jgi:vacuolar-type H+-ATPase subunit I/STV1
MEVNPVVNTTTNAVNTANNTTNSVSEPEAKPSEQNQGPDVTRLLEESRNYKKRAQEAEKKLQEQEKKKLEEEGKYKELSESYQEKLENQQKINMRLAVRTAILEPATKAGCVDIEDLLKLGDGSFLQYDAETGEVTGSEEFVQNLKNAKPWLFQQATKPVTSQAIPGGSPSNAPKKETLEELLFKQYSRK